MTTAWKDHPDGLRFLDSNVFYKVLTIGVAINILLVVLAIVIIHLEFPRYFFVWPFLIWPTSHLTYQASKSIAWKLYLKQKEAKHVVS